MAGHKRTGGDELLCESSGSTKKAKQQITKATFEKWQKEHEIEHQTLSWLRCDLDAKVTQVVSIALYVESTKPTYIRSGKTGSRVRQTKE